MKTRKLIGGYLWQRWKDVKGYEGYYKCSSLGKVKRVKGFVRTKGNSFRVCVERILIPAITGSGYYSVSLSINGISKTESIHILMAIAFLNHVGGSYFIVVDHKNGNKLNDKLSNLRIVTQRENTTTCYRGNIKNLTSKFIGVYFKKEYKRWVAQISINGKQKQLGSFDTEIEAANAYQNKLLQLIN